MYHDNRGRHSAHYTLLLNMYHDNRGRLSAHHTLLSNMYYDNRGRLSAHHNLLPNLYHDTRGTHSAHHTLLPNTYHDTEVITLLTTPCYLTYNIIIQLRPTCNGFTWRMDDPHKHHHCPVFLLQSDLIHGTLFEMTSMKHLSQNRRPHTQDGLVSIQDLTFDLKGGVQEIVRFGEIPGWVTPCLLSISQKCMLKPLIIQLI